MDFTASSGNQTRWQTGVTEGDIVYPDRAVEDEKLLVYTSAPLETDLEITGAPILTLEISSTTTDGALYAYLEDVTPEGRVTYVDEGIFRVIDRKEVNPKSLPFEPLGPAHSFLRKDAEPLIPGEVASIRFALYPTSVLLRKGHRIRVVLAGADAGLFKRYPAESTSGHRPRTDSRFRRLWCEVRRQWQPNHWRTHEDRNKFEERTACFVDEYSQFTAVDDMKVNGKLTQSEHIADNGGLRLAYIALMARAALSGVHLDTKTDGYTQVQQFFIAAAQNGCNNERPEHLRMLVPTDAHSPDTIRVKGAVVNMPEFAKAFGCQAGQPMAPGKKCRVW